MNKKQLYNFIKRRSLYNVITRDISIRVLDASEIESFKENEIINKKMDVHDLYILVTGEIDLYDEKGTLIDKVISGRSLELETLYAKELKWKYTWQARTDTVLLKIPFSKFQGLISQSPQIDLYLNRVSVLSELYKFKRDLRLINFDEDIFKSIIINLKFFDSATSSFTDFQINNEKKKLIIIKGGSLRVSHIHDATTKLIDEYFHSDYLFLKDYQDIKYSHFGTFSFWYLDNDELNQLCVNFCSVLDFLQEKISSHVREIELSQKIEMQSEDYVEPDDDRFQVKDFQLEEQYLKKLHKKKFYWLQQHDMMDCGAACMAMISRFHGKKINLSTWRSMIHITREGASMLALKKAAENVGFDSIGVFSGYTALMKLQVPMIALMQYHYVVVYQVKENAVIIADPAGQLKEVSKENFLKEFSNNSLLLKPNEDLKFFPNSKNTFLKYFELFRGEKIRIFEILMISVLIFILGLSLPLFMQFIFDNVLITLDENFLRFIALIFIGLGLINAFSEWIRTFLVAKLTSKLDSKFTSLFLSHVMKLPFSYYAVRNVGDITTRLDEMGKIRDFFSNKLVATFLNVFSFVLYSSILLLYKVSLIYVLLPFVFVFLLILYQIIKKVRLNLHDTFKAQGKMQSTVFEQMKSLETVKGLGAEISARLKFEESLVGLLQLKIKLEHIIVNLQSFSAFFQEILSLSLFISSVYFYFQEQLSLGQVVAIHALAGSIASPLIKLMQEWDEFNKIGISMEKVDEIMTSKIEEIDLSRKQHDSNVSLQGNISFENVYFQYGSEHSPMVLKNINILLPHGKVVAFVGSSGSGKSTLAYMINRLYSPTKGKIFIGDLDSEQVPLDVLRQNTAMISQDNNLFAGSFLSNITLGDPNPNYEKAVYSAKLSHAHDFIMQKPGGYYFELGEGGLGISGGQMQRINIARALYRDPNILILDEATSALDAKSEKIIVDNLKQRPKNTSTIIIAHRLNTIMHADQIFVFEKGHLIETGNHKELINSEGRYYHMFKKQLKLD